MLTKLEEYKLRYYRKQFPTIADADGALTLAIRKEHADKTMGDGSSFLLQERNTLIEFAELLEREALQCKDANKA